MTGNAKRTAVAIYALHHLRRWAKHTTSLEMSYDELRKEVMDNRGKSMLQSMLYALRRRPTDGVSCFIDISIHWDKTARGFGYWSKAQRLWMAEWNRILMFDMPASWKGFMPASWKGFMEQP